MYNPKVRELIKRDKLKEALEKIHDFIEDLKEKENDYVSLSGRLKSFENNSRTGVLDQAQKELERNQIRQSIIGFYDEIEQEVGAFSFDKHLNLSEESFQEQLVKKLSRVYELNLKPLGDGSTYVIYYGQELSSKREVAIRAMKNQDFTAVSTLEKDHENIVLATEIEKVLSLKHRNLIKIVGAFFEEFPACYSEEFIDGITLKRILVYGKWPLEEVVEVIAQIADALYYLHSKKIVHRRIRPSKVFMDQEGIPVISPFELLSEIFSSGQLKHVKKELTYLSPEQLGDQIPDEKSDQFSLALLMYELLTARSLFEGETIMEIAQDRRRFLSSATYRNRRIGQLNLPRKLSMMLKKMLAEKPEDRYAHIKEVADVLSGFESNTRREVQMVRESYHRSCLANHQFSAHFYRQLLSKPSEFADEQEETLFGEIKDVFDQPAYQNSRQRERMFRGLMKVLICNCKNDELIEGIKQKIGAHQELNAGHYAYFLSKLLITVSQNDYLWNHDIERCWNMVIGEVVEMLTEAVV